MPSGRKTMASLRSKIFGSDGIIRYFSNGISNTASRVLGRPISQQLQVILKKKTKTIKTENFYNVLNVTIIFLKEGNAVDCVLIQI